MTSNQISYANVEVNRDVAAETKRHNEATEEIQKEINRLTDEKNRMENDREVERNNIQKDYNEWYKTYMNTFGAEKDHAKAMLDLASSNLAEVDTKWKDVLNAKQIELDSANIRYRDAQTKYTEFMQGIETVNSFLKAKQVEYDAYNIENTIRLGFAQLNLDQYIRSAQVANEAKKINNQFTLQMGNLNLEAQKYSLSREQFQYFQDYNERALKLENKKTNINLFNAVRGALTPDLSGLGSLLKGASYFMP